MNEKPKDHGGPAFPFVVEGGPSSALQPMIQYGMTMRQYYAAMAMQAFIANDGGIPGTGSKSWKKRTAEVAFDMADAMIEQEKEVG